MAQVSSGSFNTTAYGNRYLKFSWSVKSTSISGNYKEISWSLVGAGGGTNYYEAGNFKVVIDGESVYTSSGRIKLWDGTTVASGTKKIYHNSTGNKSFSASVQAGIFYFDVNCSGSGSWELPSIPRYATSNQSFSSKTETSISMNWSSDSTIDYIWYSKDNGSNWTGIDVTDGKSGSYTISGLSADTTYNIKTRVRRKDSQLTTDSSALSVTTHNYPAIIDVGTSNLIIENSQTLKLYNPLSRTVTIEMRKNTSSGELLYSITTSGTSITFTPTPYNLYSQVRYAKTCGCIYNCVYSNSTRSTALHHFTVDENKCIPSFSNFSYKDTNTNVTNITGNNQILVKGKSNLQVTISSANKMVAKNNAVERKYIATIDTLNTSVDYSTNDVNIDVGTVINSGTKRLTVTAYDSRDIPKAVYKDVTVYDYAKPVINVDVTRLNNFETQTTLKVNGTFTKLNIDGADKNTISSIQYRYRESGGTWSSWTTLNTTITNGKFTCSDVILSLDNTKSFQIQVQATDKLETNTITKYLGIGQALFFISTNKKECYINNEKVMAGVNKEDVSRLVYSTTLDTDTNLTIPASVFSGISKGRTFRIEIEGISTKSDYYSMRYTSTNNYTNIQYNNGSAMNQYAYNNHWGCFYIRSVVNGYFKASIDLSFVNINGSYYYSFISKGYSGLPSSSTQVITQAGGLISLGGNWEHNLTFLSLTAGIKVRVIKI